MEPITIDCDYIQPGFACAYLLKDGDQAAFVETNTSHAVPRLLAALKAANMRPEQVSSIIITHVHLDHAGGAGRLMEACPNATLYAHPRAAPHVIDPTKLVASARHVYGDAKFSALYGEIPPVPAARVKTMEDGATLSLGSRTLTFLHTRGHANHHFCVKDSGSGGIFTGDAFGLCYPALQSKGLFIFPSTSPTDFDAAEARKSVRRIVDTGSSTAFLTHFGGVKNLPAAAAQLLHHLDVAESILDAAVVLDAPDDALDAYCAQRLEAHFQTTLKDHGLPQDGFTWEVVRLDCELNGQGIAHVARKRRAKK